MKKNNNNNMVAVYIIIIIMVLLVITNHETSRGVNLSSLTFNSLGISTGFDSGQAQEFMLVSTNEYNFRLRMTPGDSWNSAWANFVMKDVKDRTIKFNILGVGSVGEFYKNQNPNGKQMVYSCDGNNWDYMAPGNYNNNTKVYTFSHKFECDVVQIATYIPYSYENMQSFIHSKKTNANVRVRTIGKSEQGRNIDMIEITDFTINENNKRHVVIVARQHPSEPYANHMIHGLINELLSNPAYSQKLHFYIVPIANPDGVVLGYSRRNFKEIDPNRDWSNEATAEIKSIKTEFKKIDSEVGVEVFIDWHSFAGGESRTGIISGRGTKFLTLANMLKAKGKFGHTSGAYIDGSSTACTQSTSTGATASSFGCSLGAEVTFTFEPGQSSPSWTIDSLRTHGAYTAQAIYELYEGTTPPPIPEPTLPPIPTNDEWKVIWTHPNGGFELGKQNWSVRHGYTIDTSTVHTGTYSMKSSSTYYDPTEDPSTGDARAMWTSYKNVKPGQKVFASAWMKTTKSDCPYGVRIGIDFQTQDSKILHVVNGDFVSWGNDGSPWTYREISGEVKEGDYKAVLWLQTKPYDCASTAWFDDIVFQVTELKTTTIEPDDQVVCTADAKICQDGSFVSRDPDNNCEFKTCPTIIPDDGITADKINSFIEENSALLIVVAVMIMLMILARNNNRRRR